MTYGELKTLIAGYLHRTDLEDMIPSFIILAQARLNHDITHTVMDTAAAINATVAEPNITLPTGFLHFVRVRAPYQNGYRPLVQQTLEQNAEIIDSREGSVGAPQYYALINMTTAELAPVPEESIVLTCVYRKRLTAFTLAGDTDGVLTAFPNAYLYASLIEASTYVNSDKRIAIWKNLYDIEIARIADADYEARWSDSPRSISNFAADTP